jgi:prolyl oligopeptidase
VKASFKLARAEVASVQADANALVAPRTKRQAAEEAISVLGITATLLGFCVLFFAVTDHETPPKANVVLGLILMAFALFLVLLLLWFGFRAKRAIEGAHADRLTQRIEIELTPEGLRARDSQEDSLLDWRTVSKVVDSGSFIYIVCSSRQVLFVPRSAFAAQEDYDAFVRALREHARCDTSATPWLRERSRYGLGSEVTIGSALVMSFAAILGSKQLEAHYPKGSQPVVSGDSFAWLEEEDRVSAWVLKQSNLVAEALAKSTEFRKTSATVYGLRGDGTQAPELQKIGDRYMNFWRDAKSHYGVWRWTTLEEFKKPNPRWETLIDLDAINRVEKTAWKWASASCLPPANNRCLVWLSNDDAQGYAIREYDIGKRSWVPDGFRVPLGDVRLTWIDQDAVAADMPSNVQPNSATWRPAERRRALKRWGRGTELAEASHVFEGNTAAVKDIEPTKDNVIYDEKGESSRSLVDAAAFPHWMTADGRLARVIVPDRSTIQIHGPWIFIVPHKRWTVDARTYEGGSVLVGDLNSYMQGQRDLTVLFVPTATSVLAQTAPIVTKSHVVLNVLDDVKHRLLVLTLQSSGEWRKRELPPMPGMNRLTVWAVDSKDSDAIWIRSKGFLAPQQLFVQNLDADAPQLLKSAPHQFDSSRHDVEQRFAASKDGTKIPYFLVRPRERARDGSIPTLLHAYGGFGVAQLPDYSAEVGKLWLERGGAYVLANIRGGGEYGPRWHEAATQSRRQRVNEDLAAVAQDLLSYGVTSPKRLVMHGISNGGLLAGNMLTQYPELFAAIVVESGLLDMRGYHRMAKGTTWIAEYGLPEAQSDWNFMKRFSPYHLVDPKRPYPPTLFITSKDDDVVHPAHGRKMTALLQSVGKKAYYLELAQGRHGKQPDPASERFKLALAYHFMWEAATTQP